MTVTAIEGVIIAYLTTTTPPPFDALSIWLFYLMVNPALPHPNLSVCESPMSMLEVFHLCTQYNIEYWYKNKLQWYVILIQNIKSLKGNLCVLFNINVLHIAVTSLK